MNVRPLQDRILVRRVEEVEKTRGGIIIPDSAKERPLEGKVIAVGSGKRTEDGTLANAVKITLGPRGRNVVIEKSWGAPTVTKDGVTVAKEIALENKFETMGAQMVKEVASKTSDN